MEVVSIDQVEEGGQFVIKVKHWEPAHIAKRMLVATEIIQNTYSRASVSVRRNAAVYIKVQKLFRN